MNRHALKRKNVITDADSPDFSTCVHCGKAIGWDDYSYTHMDSGFADCGVIVGKGEDPKGVIRQVAEALGILGRVHVNPEMLQDPDYRGMRAEPKEWFIWT